MDHAILYLMGGVALAGAMNRTQPGKWTNRQLVVIAFVWFPVLLFACFRSQDGNNQR